MQASLFLSSSASGDGRLGLLKLVVSIFDFRDASDYTMASNMFLLVIDFIKG